MLFRRRPKPEPAPRVRGHATIVQVGASNVQTQQDSVVVKLRLRIELDGREPYECTVRWNVQVGSMGGVRAGARFSVEVPEDAPEQVHPTSGGARLLWT